MEEERDITAAESPTDGANDGRISELFELDDAGLSARFDLGAEEPEDFDGRDSGEEELRSCGPRVILSRVDQLTEGDRDWLRDDTEAAGEDVLVAFCCDATEFVGEGAVAALEGERTILAIDADDEREGGDTGSLLAPTFRLDSDEVLLRRTATVNRLALLLLLLPPDVVVVNFVVRPPGLTASADEEELDEQLDERDELRGATVTTFFLDSERMIDAEELLFRCTGRSEETDALEPLRDPPLSAELLAFEAADDDEADFLACRFALL